MGHQGRNNANGEGSLYRRTSDGLWVAALTLDDGRRRTLTSKSRQEAQRKLAAALQDRAHGVTLGDARQTLRDYFPRWLETMRPTVKPGTLRAYERDVRLRIAPKLGSVALAKLTPQHLQAFYAEILAGGLSTTSARHCHNVLHHGLDDAMRLGLIGRNVSELVNAPRPRRIEMQTWSEEESKRFLGYCASVGDRQYALYALALATGMRLGELLALTWRSVELPQRRVHVRATVRKVRDDFEFGEPKTKHSRRQVTIDAPVVEVLREHRVRQNKERLARGSAWDDRGLVFPDEQGSPLSTFRVYPSHFLALARAAEVPRIRFHDLRHTCATILLGREVNPKIVSEMLGHSSVAITLDLYSHVRPDMQRAASEQLGSALFG